MNQLTQQLKRGKLEIIEVPFPALNEGKILVRNHYSVISPGTEGKTVEDARKGYIGKAISRQKEVNKVIESIKRNGLIYTYNVVMNRLEAPSPLGYSCAGEVIAVGKGVNNFSVGDRVACGGQGAYHADVVSVYENLCVNVPADISLKQAAFSTIASIAIQGIRQAELTLGENAVIVGLGLIGQLTGLILESSGVRVIGIDISEKQVKLSKDVGLRYVYNRNQEGLEEKIYQLTNGHGADAIIIAAGTDSLDPVEFSGQIARKKGKVVIVGAVPTGFSRENYYRKELDLRMSCSYGPGRYDSNYEEKGRDYPVGYVRWTENRNMQSFIGMLEDKKLDISGLITHTFKLVNAPEAYDLIINNSESHAGILIEYDYKSDISKRIQFGQPSGKYKDPNVGFIGAGNFAQGTLLPTLKGKCNLVAIASGHGNTSVYVAKKYGFAKCYESGDEVINDKDVNTVFIATRHNLHAEFIKKTLQAGKNIFVEKPIAMSFKELEEIGNLYESLTEKPMVMVGYNRRFSPYVQNIIGNFLDSQQKAIIIRVNAGNLPDDHWVDDPDIGGGRIIGEACHFIDLAMYIAGSRIKRINAIPMDDCSRINKTVNISMSFVNGSVANICYFSNGSNKLPKEYLEVYCGGAVAKIDNYDEMTIYSKGKNRLKLGKQKKGHQEEIYQFIDAIKNGGNSPIPFSESYHSSYATLMVLKSIKNNRQVEI